MKFSQLFLVTLLCCGFAVAADKCGCSKPKPSKPAQVKEMPKPMPQKSAAAKPADKREEAKA